MSQFWIHRNANAATRESFPYLLDIQNPLLEALDTRLVLPLAPSSRFAGKDIKKLTPVVEVEGIECLILPPQAAGVHRKHLGEAVADLSARRGEIVSAVDFLITGF